MNKSTFRIFHTVRGDSTKYYHIDASCRVSEDLGDAGHYVVEGPEDQLKLVRTNFERAYRNMQFNRNYRGRTWYNGASLDQITTRIELVPVRHLRQEDRLTFKRRFGHKIAA